MKKIHTHLNAAHRQHAVTKNDNNNFIDLLAVLGTGVILCLQHY